MNPVFPNETRRERVLRAARIRLTSSKDRTGLSTETVDELCEEFLALHASLFCVHDVSFSQSCGFCLKRAADIEPGTYDEEGKRHG